MIDFQKTKPEDLTIKLWWYNRDCTWEKVDPKDFALCDLKGHLRLLFEVNNNINENKKFYVVTNHDDEMSIRKKHGQKYPVIRADQVLNFFKQERIMDEIVTVMPTVAAVASEFNAKVV